MVLLHLFDENQTRLADFRLYPSMQIETSERMDGWMTCDFTSFSTVFELYQDDERLIMELRLRLRRFRLERGSNSVR